MISRDAGFPERIATHGSLQRSLPAAANERSERIATLPSAPDALTGTSLIRVLEPDPFDAIKATWCVSAVVNVCVGDCAVDVPPSSKIQSQLVAWGELVSVKLTGLPAVAAEKVKSATGGARE
jgi:hypothetical protein